ncbi:MAG: hypothetical protein SGJ16_11875 [Nitrospirota bacterium]|nr:hypothetical protein [Nitrospirota bacterium]
MPRIRLKKPCSFLIVDDHATVRRGLRQVVAVATQLKSHMRLAAHLAGDVGAAASEDHTKGDS